MLTFAKSQAAASIASLVDYCVTVFFVEIIGTWYVASNAVGTAAGGLVNFYLNRSWAFPKGIRSRRIQFIRFTIVWVGYLLLTSAGIFLLTHYLHLNYLFSKIVVSLGLAFGYNYPLQKRFVFR